jgi:hypothetical protein
VLQLKQCKSGAAGAVPPTSSGENSPSALALPPVARSTAPPPAWSLGTIPQLSQRAQLTLLLRRAYEHAHMGGFERLSPPQTPQLAERYRRLVEYVPPSMRETFAFAKRRMEALAQRAAAEAKRASVAGPPPAGSRV